MKDCNGRIKIISMLKNIILK